MTRLPFGPTLIVTTYLILNEIELLLAFVTRGRGSHPAFTVAAFTKAMAVGQPSFFCLAGGCWATIVQNAYVTPLLVHVSRKLTEPTWSWSTDK